LEQRVTVSHSTSGRVDTIARVLLYVCKLTPINLKHHKMGNKRKKCDESEYEYDPAPKQIGHIKNQEKRLIVILENAQLESVKVRL